MTEFNCFRCGYRTKSRTCMKNHFNKKKKCELKLEYLKYNEDQVFRLSFIPYKDALNTVISESEDTAEDTDNINLFKENIIHSIEFIDTCLEENKPVYVHCYYGLMRSATVVAAYLMKKYKIPKDLAIILVKEQRPMALSSFYNFNEILDYVENKYKLKPKSIEKEIKNENEEKTGNF